MVKYCLFLVKVSTPIRKNTPLCPLTTPPLTFPMISPPENTPHTAETPFLHPIHHSSLLLGDFPKLGVPMTHTRIALGLVGVGLSLLSTAAAIGALSLGGVPLGGVYLWLLPVVCVSLGLINTV